MTALDVLIGVDKGTSSIKTIAVDAATGRTVAQAGCVTPSSRPAADRHEEDCEATWLATAGTIARVTAALPAGTTVLSVGVTGHMGGVWALDDRAQPVGPAICWPDARAAGILERVRAQDGDHARSLYDIGGNAMISGMPYPLLAWLKEHDPARYARIRHVVMAKDFINLRLTGVLATDESDLSFWPCDLRNRTVSPELFARFGIPEAQAFVPPVRDGRTRLGGVTAAAAALTGLPVGTPVAGGCGDAAANMLGVGALGDGQATTTLGTSLMNGTSSATAVLDPADVGFSFLMPEGRWQRQITNSGGGTLCLDWVMSTFCAATGDQIARGGTTLGAVVDAAMDATVPGNDGLLFHPYLNTAGATAPFVDGNARGSFVGFGPDTTADQLIRAVLEGTALAVRDCYEAMPVAIDEIRLTGGGARSAPWCQTIADVLQKPMTVPDVEESGALGAAMLGGLAVGAFHDLDHAGKALVRPGSVFHPRPEHAAVHDHAFATYRALLGPLAAVWAASADHAAQGGTEEPS
ncbi:FGGY-family carbohydrate kinase [Nakamurella leprariae]|uniref:Carbohydrate kinase n=1 Tax=Nakamurella leprariae TaxID=2803911 RepID=A0A939BYF5_9ACTN|nr:FGGY family carbohydrate kinase [Nakamurella leprariae]MBM9466556.1 hypothetical protein [Nakamurella leprariae]